MTAVRRIADAITARIPAPDCCPHPDLDDTPDTAYLPADTISNDYRGSVTNG